MSLRIELAAKYSKDIREWRSGLSRFLDADGLDGSILIPLYQRQRNVLNLAYYHAVLLIHRPFLLSNFASLSNIDTRPGSVSNVSTTQNILQCLEGAMGIVRIVDDLYNGRQIFRAFWFTQYYAFCAVVVLYIYRIQQHIVEPGKCEGYFTAGQKCQAQLSALSDTDCLSKRYCLVLEELRLEAARQTGKAAGPLASPPKTHNITNTIDSAIDPNLSNLSAGTLQVPASTPQSDTSPSFAAPFYDTNNNLPTPESAVFSSSWVPNSNFMADLTSWGQFDSLVTAGVGVLDGGLQGDGGWGFGFGR